MLKTEIRRENQIDVKRQKNAGWGVPPTPYINDK